MSTDKSLTKEQTKLLADRKEWEAQYDHWLKRKNNFAAKLQTAGSPIETSKKYTQLATECKKFWQLLHDTLPEYKAMFK